MNRWALACAVFPAIVACGSSSKVIESSAPERPTWVESAPASRDELYFVGTCTDLPSYQEALRCARSEALADVAAWVGARLSASAYSASSESMRSSGTMVYYDSEMFLADARRTATYHEVRQEGWGRSYRVSVLLTYPRAEAERERARIGKTTDRSDRLVLTAPATVRGLADEGRWGQAMQHILDVADDVALPRNLNRTRHIDRLAVLVGELVAPLRLSGSPHDARVEALAIFGDTPAAGVPLECSYAGITIGAVTSMDGRAACTADEWAAARMARVTLRPDIAAYIAALPAQAGALASALGALLDHSIVLEIGTAPDMTAALSADPGCEAALSELRRRLLIAGVRLVEDAEQRLHLTCEVRSGGQAGTLSTATARGAVFLTADGTSVPTGSSEARGLGATPSASRDEALLRLGGGLANSVLELLRRRAADRRS
ncbi:MAG: hypothetical protein PVI01_06255 [Gemmatimonadales bacterium]